MPWYFFDFFAMSMISTLARWIAADEAPGHRPETELVDLGTLAQRLRRRLEDVRDGGRRQRARHVPRVVAPRAVGEQEEPELGAHAGRGPRCARAGRCPSRRPRWARARASSTTGSWMLSSAIGLAVIPLSIRRPLRRRKVGAGRRAAYLSSATCSPKIRSIPERSASPTSTRQASPQEHRLGAVGEAHAERDRAVPLRRRRARARGSRGPRRASARRGRGSRSTACRRAPRRRAGAPRSARIVGSRGASPSSSASSSRCGKLTLPVTSTGSPP